MNYAKQLDRNALITAVWSAAFTRALDDASTEVLRSFPSAKATNAPVLRQIAKSAARYADLAVEALRLFIDAEFRLIASDDLDDCYMPWEEFAAACRGGAFTDDDGHGELATDDHHVSNLRIYPGDALRDDYPRPDWATHVCWYNK